MEKIEKTEEQWKKELTPEQYQILRGKETEAPFTGKYVNSKDKGMYVCAACGNQLFDSDTKFESGTGWPSFDRAIPGAVEFHDDSSHGMRRTEVTCAKCGSHLGHIFDDGPAETTGKRFCINSACLMLDRK
ncbi:peptide-methionine (R)-S-oxide reductase MsrB [Patescibacteria group bacterium]|nr:peptide-methionine (R)-S-oxide reductase MsrB [Patescibacteria group bacterium]